ncbi:MAG TPA: CDGSH iron-sulfur domain-containing protein [Aeromicrobium sp.]|nr:CDGSH iron-sulfur domain-containing protein [Aeromicrobium sp.]
MDATTRYELTSDRPVEIQCVPHGPALVRFATSVRADNGAEIPVQRPVVALCVCGFSARRPWCDGTHKGAAIDQRQPVVISTST